MTSVTCTCPSCKGDAREDSENMIIRSFPDGCVLTYTCPLCNHLIQHPTNDESLEALVKARIRIVPVSVPLEALEPHVGPPISHDDILDFHIELGDE